MGVSRLASISRGKSSTRRGDWQILPAVSAPFIDSFLARCIFPFSPVSLSSPNACKTTFSPSLKWNCWTGVHMESACEPLNSTLHDPAPSIRSKRKPVPYGSVLYRVYAPFLFFFFLLLLLSTALCRRARSIFLNESPARSRKEASFESRFFRNLSRITGRSEISHRPIIINITLDFYNCNFQRIFTSFLSHCACFVMYADCGTTKSITQSPNRNAKCKFVPLGGKGKNHKWIVAGNDYIEKLPSYYALQRRRM